MEYAGVAGLLVEEEPEYTEVEDRQPEVDRGEVLVFLHEEVGSVADVEVGHDEGQPGQREHEVGEGVARNIPGAQSHGLLDTLVPVVPIPSNKQLLKKNTPTFLFKG